MQDWSELVPFNARSRFIVGYENTFIEKNVQAHCATLMRTNDFDARNDEAITFFKNMLYEIDPSEYGLSASAKAPNSSSKGLD